MQASHEDGQSDLGRHLLELGQCVSRAKEQLNDMLSKNPEYAAKIRKRSHSNVMNDFVTHNIRERFTDAEEVILKERYGQLQVIFSCKYVMKSKKSDNLKRLSFIPTQLALGFMRQVRQLELPNMPEPTTNIVLTWQFNKTRTDIEKVAIVCPASKNTFLWTLEIPLRPEYALPTIPTPTAPQPIAGNSLGTKRVVPKRPGVGKKRVKDMKIIQGELRNNNEERRETDQS